MPLKGLTPKAYTDLIQALMRLPGIGEQNAWRLAQSCLQSDRGRSLFSALEQAASLNICPSCNAYTQDEVCSVCRDSSRDINPMAVVLSMEERASLLEQYQHVGHVFVLPKLLMPASGVGLKETGIPILIKRIKALNIQQLYLVLPETANAKLSIQFIADMLDPATQLWQVTHLNQWPDKDTHIRIKST